jgi:prepilin-type processing-associated H-X9-DG protein
MALLKNVQFFFLTCPSSPMSWACAEQPYHPDLSGIMASAMYTGISGAKDHKTARLKAAPYGDSGRLSFGGMLHGPFDKVPSLPRMSMVRMSKVTDGTSKTMIVGEQSDFCRDASGMLIECKSDCNHGFAMGPGHDGTERSFNMSTVLHPINSKSTSLLGVGGNCKPNSPIQSAHSGGAHVLFVDGSVHFIRETIAIQTFYDLANRDDGHVLPEL